MILQHMTPEEKVRQASRLELDIRSSALSWVEHSERLLKKRQSYPFTHVIQREYKGMGRWNIILCFEEKPNFRKGVVFTSNAYQKFYVDKGAKPENIGAGIYFLGSSVNSYSGRSGISFHELSPHFFNRFRERYIDRYHIPVKGFDNLVLLAIETLHHTIICDRLFEFVDTEEKNSFMSSQNIPHYEGYDNLALFTRHGIVFGMSRKDYDCYVTYVDREDFYQGQQAFYGDVVKLYELHDRLKARDPYYFADRAKLENPGVRYDFVRQITKL